MMCQLLYLSTRFLCTVQPVSSCVVYTGSCEEWVGWMEACRVGWRKALGYDMQRRRYWALGGDTGAWRLYVEEQEGCLWGWYEGTHETHESSRCQLQCIQLALHLWPLSLCAHPYLQSINATMISMASQHTNGHMHGWFNHAHTLPAPLAFTLTRSGGSVTICLQCTALCVTCVSGKQRSTFAVTVRSLHP